MVSENRQESFKQEEPGITPDGYIALEDITNWLAEEDATIEAKLGSLTTPQLDILSSREELQTAIIAAAEVSGQQKLLEKIAIRLAEKKRTSEQS
jgi:hypothetical protein